MNYLELLNFWFGFADSPEYGKPQGKWFTKDAEFDQEMRSRFLSDHQLAATGELDSWKELPLSCLALIILLDQFPRNVFRDTPQAFATDSLALELAQGAIAQGFDQQLLPVQRWFIYLPLEHDENLANQERSVELFARLRQDAIDNPNHQNTHEYAVRHRNVIAQFGRFPHRNEILGRKNTPAETEFLQQPGSSF